MTIAIYSRKSKLTETGDSINNQISMCKNYCKIHFKECEFLIYEDEGFSGGSTDRPMFKKLLKDIKSKKFDVLICYRLDRISRNVGDFANTWKLLEYNNIAFISVTENFDTSTPLGKAMLSISSVFAELERNTTAQRITDNFTELSKSRRYLVGTPPEGFKKKKCFDDNGKYYNILEVVPNEAERINIIFKKYLEYQTLGKVSKYCIKNNITNKNGNHYTPSRIAEILRHELYAAADKYTYEYFKKKKYQIVAASYEFNGSCGINIYRKTKAFGGRHTAVNEYENRIIGVGEHIPIISSQDWIEVQNLLEKRSRACIKNTAASKTGLLNGLLKCPTCGSRLRPVCVRKNGFYYACTLREQSHGILCGEKSLSSKIEKNIIEMVERELLNKEKEKKILKKQKYNIKQYTIDTESKIKKINLQINSNNKSIENLVIKLSKISGQILLENIEKQVEKLYNQNKQLKIELDKLCEQKKTEMSKLTNLKTKEEAINNILNSTFAQTENIIIKRNMLKTLINEIIWNGKEIKIILF